MNGYLGYSAPKSQDPLQSLLELADIKEDGPPSPAIIIWTDKILVVRRKCAVVMEEVGPHLEVYSARTPCDGARVEHVGFQIKNTRTLCEHDALRAGRPDVHTSLHALFENSQAARSYKDLLVSLLDEIENSSFVYVQR